MNRLHLFVLTNVTKSALRTLAIGLRKIILNDAAWTWNKRNQRKINWAKCIFPLNNANRLKGNYVSSSALPRPFTLKTLNCVMGRLKKFQQISVNFQFLKSMEASKRLAIKAIILSLYNFKFVIIMPQITIVLWALSPTMTLDFRSMRRFKKQSN